MRGLAERMVSDCSIEGGTCDSSRIGGVLLVGSGCLLLVVISVVILSDSR